jgi:hypothetical protein
VAVQRDGEKQLVVSGSGHAIAVCVAAVEAAKRRVPGMCQITSLGHISIKEVFDPIEEGLDQVTVVKSVPAIFLTLSLLPLDTSNVGYQDPLPLTEVKTDRTPDQFAFDMAPPPSRSGGSHHGYAGGAARGHGRGGHVGRDNAYNRGHDPRARGRGGRHEGYDHAADGPHHSYAGPGPAAVPQQPQMYPPAYADMLNQMAYFHQQQQIAQAHQQHASAVASAQSAASSTGEGAPTSAPSTPSTAPVFTQYAGQVPPGYPQAPPGYAYMAPPGVGHPGFPYPVYYMGGPQGMHAGAPHPMMQMAYPGMPGFVYAPGHGMPDGAMQRQMYGPGVHVPVQTAQPAGTGPETKASPPA